MKKQLQLEAAGTKSSMIVYAVSIAPDAESPELRAAEILFLFIN